MHMSALTAAMSAGMASSVTPITKNSTPMLSSGAISPACHLQPRLDTEEQRVHDYRKGALQHTVGHAHANVGERRADRNANARGVVQPAGHLLGIKRGRDKELVVGELAQPACGRNAKGVHFWICLRQPSGADRRSLGFVDKVWRALRRLEPGRVGCIPATEFGRLVRLRAIETDVRVVVFRVDPEIVLLCKSQEKDLEDDHDKGLGNVKRCSIPEWDYARVDNVGDRIPNNAICVPSDLGNLKGEGRIVKGILGVSVDPEKELMDDEREQQDGQQHAQLVHLT